MAMTTRRKCLLGGAAGLAAAAVGGFLVLRPKPAPIGFSVSAAELADARDLLARHPAVDSHAHPGRTFVDGVENLTPALWLYTRLGTFEDRTVADMQTGGMAAATFAAVSDIQVLGLQGEGLASVRDFQPGEAWQSYRRQIGKLRQLEQRGLVYPVRKVADIAAARAAGKVGAILAVEGGDFLEGRPERVAQAHADGVRVITLMHYRNNELGDIITGQAVQGRLSDAGIAVVQAMNRVGIVVDVAHASQATALDTIKASRAPVLASHVHIHTRQLVHPRFISAHVARAVAEHGGGVLGAWPAGIGIADLNGFVERTFELINTVGIDHVCMGTDMDANYMPVFDTYANLPYYVAGLRQRGLSEPEVAKLIGGNFMRLLAAAQAV
jgi:membrane dipeptidase